MPAGRFVVVAALTAVVPEITTTITHNADRINFFMFFNT
jgi:hypothetical protein